MDVGAVRVEGYYEMLALHRYLFECKGEDISSEYAGSPFIAAIQNRLADALEAAIRDPDGRLGAPRTAINSVLTRYASIWCQPQAAGTA